MISHFSPNRPNQAKPIAAPQQTPLNAQPKFGTVGVAKAEAVDVFVRAVRKASGDYLPLHELWEGFNAKIRRLESDKRFAAEGLYAFTRGRRRAAQEEVDRIAAEIEKATADQNKLADEKWGPAINAAKNVDVVPGEHGNSTILVIGKHGESAKPLEFPASFTPINHAVAQDLGYKITENPSGLTIAELPDNMAAIGTGSEHGASQELLERLHREHGALVPDAHTQLRVHPRTGLITYARDEGPLRDPYPGTLGHPHAKK